jgi:hypothetical protein
MDIDQALITAAVGAFSGILGAIVAERRMRRDFRLELSAEALARELLMHPKWQRRNFATIKRHIGGFQDDELRQILVRAGAVRFEGQDDGEWWGLVKRNRAQLMDENAHRRRKPAVGPKPRLIPDVVGAAPADGPKPAGELPGAPLTPKG